MPSGAASTILRVWSDPFCPYGYLLHHRLRRVLSEPAFRDRVVVRPMALNVERDTGKPARKPVIEAEATHLMLLEPGIPYQPWARASWEWPVTSWPASEAVKCAERQGVRAAWDLDWAIRTAFFAESACPSVRGELLAIAARVPALDLDRFTADFDAGVAKRQVMDETEDGWYARDFDVSPVLVLPDDTAVENPGGQLVKLAADANWKVVEFHRGDADPTATVRALVERAVKQSA